MKRRLLPAMLAVLALTAAAVAQDSGSAPPPGQNSNQNSGPGNGGGYGQRGGRGGYGGGMMGRGLMGTVTEVAADHFTIKTEMGEVYTVHFSANTRITRQPAGMRGPGGGGGGGGQGTGGGGRGGYGGGGNPPQEIKATDIKVGDAIAAMGDIDATAKSVGAMRIVQLDPDNAKRMQEMAANFGKTWLQGKVTAINGTSITLTGALDNAPHTVVADENTEFRRRRGREPITLADIQVGDTIGVVGAVKDGVFTATAVDVGGGMGGPPPNGPSAPPAGAPPGPPPSSPPQ
jgi:preprotein translocase subunit YajC